MSTEITVVVGADSLLKRDKSTRNARRRDRLDSEALRNQVKDKAEEEDKSKGFNNKKNEHDPSRDPAAHARKKDVSVSGFTLCNISELYTQESVIGGNEKGGKVRASGGKFMDIYVTAIKDDGTFGNQVEFSFNRNRLDPIFYVDQKDLGVNLRDLEQYFTPSGPGYRTRSVWDQPHHSYGAQYELGVQSRREGIAFGPTQTIDTPAPNSYIRNLDGSFRANDGFTLGSVPSGLMPGGPGNFEQYLALGEDFDFGAYNFSQDINQNLYFSLGSASDIPGGNKPGYLDPGYQLYMLPLNENHSYLVFLFTDVAFTVRGIAGYKGSMSHEINVEGTFPGYNPDTSSYYVGLGGTRDMSPPEYFNPPGLDITDYNVKFTDEALSKLQQIKIVELKNGTAKIISDSNIPSSLREHFTSMMPLSGEQFTSWDVEIIFFGSGRTKEYFWDTQDLYYGYFYSQITDTPSSVVYRERVLAWRDINKIKLGNAITPPAYSTNQARERSLAKGYGFGFLETSNHFDSPYVDPGNTSFQPESNYMANDRIFSPAIYTYLSRTASPATNYSTVMSSFFLEAPTHFVSIDFDKASVVTPPSDLSSFSVSAPVDESLVSTGKQIPGFSRSTHFAWNWEKPQYCWQQLIDMGFTAAMIGPKPENPTDE